MVDVGEVKDKKDEENGDASKAGKEESHLQPLLAIGTAVTTLAAVLGTLAFSGLLARLPRNHPVWATIAFGLVILGAAFWTVATLYRDDTKRSTGATRFLAAGILVFAGGLCVAVGAVFHTFSQDEKPRIEVKFDRKTGLSADVKVGGLASNDKIDVKVFGLWRSDETDTGWKWSVLYNAAVGPDADGLVDHRIELPIAAGTFELVEVNALTAEERTEEEDDQKEGVERQEPRCTFSDEPSKRSGVSKNGCLMFTLPRHARVAELDSKFNRAKRTVVAKVTAQDAPYRALLQISFIRGGSKHLLLRELLMTDSLGDLDYRRSVAVPPGPGRVCALTTWYRSGEKLPRLRCPKVTDNETVWTLLPVP